MTMPLSAIRLPSLRSLRGWWPDPWRLGALRLAGAFAALLALGCGAWAVDGEIGEMRMIAALQQGGQIIYLRHADRGHGPREKLSRDSPVAEFADCGQQRNLTPNGRDQARRLGGYWRKLRIPVGRVIASGQCRTRDTALLAFGHVAMDRRLYDLDFMRARLLETPDRATNTVIVSSDYPLRALTGIDLDYAEMAVVKPDGHGGVRVIARLDLADWAEAAEPGWWSAL